MFFAALLRCTSYNGNAIFSGNQSISTVRAGLDGSRRTRRFAQDSTVLAGLDGSRRTRRFSQDSTVRAGLDGSRRTRRFAQDSTVLAGLDGSRRTRQVLPFHYPFGRYGASYLLAATAPHILPRTEGLGPRQLHKRNCVAFA